MNSVSKKKKKKKKKKKEKSLLVIYITDWFTEIQKLFNGNRESLGLDGCVTILCK
jgi:hypothetical protein